MGKNTEYSQGYYAPTYKSKYVGKGKPFYRSSYERRIYYWCDHNNNVLEWSAESLAIPYLFETEERNLYTSSLLDIAAFKSSDAPTFAWIR